MFAQGMNDIGSAIEGIVGIPDNEDSIGGGQGSSLIPGGFMTDLIRCKKAMQASPGDFRSLCHSSANENVRLNGRADPGRFFDHLYTIGLPANNPEVWCHVAARASTSVTF
jgi:hypothetical protein